jgi:hypothetical protein
VKITSTVQVNKRWDHVMREYREAVEHALHDAGKVAVHAAKASASERSQTGTMASEIDHTRPSEIRGRKSGMDVLVYAKPFYALYQNWGTLDSRTRKLKQPGRERKRQGTGVKPLYFMEKGRSAGRKVLLARLAAHIRRVK